MYFDRRRHIRVWLAAAAVLLTVLIGLFAGGRSTAEVQAETEYSIRETIQRSALQCFAVEGAYPESLQYLMDNYGLRINTADYYVEYESFADNLPPEVRVVKKEG